MISDAGRHLLFVILVFICHILEKGHAATPAEWRGQSIYQVLTDRFARTDGSVKAACAPGYEGYCGGTWKGIISKLDYIQEMGFTAIWISPVVEQISDASRAYHGYSASNIYALNENFGTASDLKALAKALHKKGMYLMVDVVANHMAYDGTAETVDYSTLTPFDDKSYFHNICWINDYDDQTDVEQCWLGEDNYPLPDLNTTLISVRDMFSSWVGDFVSNYSIDGLRVDTVKNVEQSFWPIFNSASGVYNVGELSNGNVDYFCPYQDYMDGLLDYPTYYQATLFFSNTSANSTNFLNEIQVLNSKCKDQTLLGSFSENHDQPRFASITSDMSLAKNIITYTMLGDGIPIIYQGQEQHLNGATDPYNREALWLTHYTKSTLYKHTKTLNKIRSQAISKSSTYLTWNTQVVHNDTNTVAFRKGDESYMTLMIVNNLGENASKYSLSMTDVGFPAGLKVVDMLNCGKSLTVDGNGGLEVEIKGGLPSVYYPLYLVKGSNLCSGSPLFAAPVRLSITVAILTCVFLGLSSVF